MRIPLLCLIMAMLFVPSLSASPSDTVNAPVHRPLSSSYNIELGSASILSSYLSPIRYTGFSGRLSASWRQAMAHNPKGNVMEFDASIRFADTQNPQKNSVMTDINFALGWNMQWRFFPCRCLQLAVGPGAELSAGATYLPRNSNNPVAARAAFDFTLAASAFYSTRIGRLDVRFSDAFTLPSLGVFFSPQYGQSYYEIYLGDRSGLVHFGWWGNHFQLRNTLAAEVKVRSTWLKLGYHIDCLSSYVNRLDTRIITHSAIIGITTDWLNVTGRQADNPTIIPAIY